MAHLPLTEGPPSTLAREDSPLSGAPLCPRMPLQPRALDPFAAGPEARVQGVRRRGSRGRLLSVDGHLYWHLHRRRRHKGRKLLADSGEVPATTSQSGLDSGDTQSAFSPGGSAVPEGGSAASLISTASREEDCEMESWGSDDEASGSEEDVPTSRGHGFLGLDSGMELQAACAAAGNAAAAAAAAATAAASAFKGMPQQLSIATGTKPEAASQGAATSETGTLGSRGTASPLAQTSGEASASGSAGGTEAKSPATAFTDPEDEASSDNVSGPHTSAVEGIGAEAHGSSWTDVSTASAETAAEAITGVEGGTGAGCASSREANGTDGEAVARAEVVALAEASSGAVASAAAAAAAATAVVAAAEQGEMIAGFLRDMAQQRQTELDSLLAYRIVSHTERRQRILAFLQGGDLPREAPHPAEGAEGDDGVVAVLLSDAQASEVRLMREAAERELAQLRELRHVTGLGREYRRELEQLVMSGPFGPHHHPFLHPSPLPPPPPTPTEHQHQQQHQAQERLPARVERSAAEEELLLLRDQRPVTGIDQNFRSELDRILRGEVEAAHQRTPSLRSTHAQPRAQLPHGSSPHPRPGGAQDHQQPQHPHHPQQQRQPQPQLQQQQELLQPLRAGTNAAAIASQDHTAPLLTDPAAPSQRHTYQERDTMQAGAHAEVASQDPAARVAAHLPVASPGLVWLRDGVGYGPLAGAGDVGRGPVSVAVQEGTQSLVWAGSLGSGTEEEDEEGEEDEEEGHSVAWEDSVAVEGEEEEGEESADEVHAVEAAHSGAWEEILDLRRQRRVSGLEAGFRSELERVLTGEGRAGYQRTLLALHATHSQPQAPRVGGQAPSVRGLSQRQQHRRHQQQQDSEISELLSRRSVSNILASEFRLRLESIIHSLIAFRGGFVAAGPSAQGAPRAPHGQQQQPQPQHELRPQQHQQQQEEQEQQGAARHGQDEARGAGGRGAQAPLPRPPPPPPPPPSMLRAPRPPQAMQPPRAGAMANGTAAAWALPAVHTPEAWAGRPATGPDRPRAPVPGFPLRTGPGAGVGAGAGQQGGVGPSQRGRAQAERQPPTAGMVAAPPPPPPPPGPPSRAAGNAVRFPPLPPQGEEAGQENIWRAWPARRPAVTNELQEVEERLGSRLGRMEQLMDMCLNMMAELQRSQRQELAGALTSLAAAAAAGGHSATAGAPQAPHPHLDVAASSALVRAGTCCVCCDAAISCLLYRCGHMCTCIGCGQELLERDQPCPLCRAPIREVVRAYTVST